MAARGSKNGAKSTPKTQKMSEHNISNCSYTDCDSCTEDISCFKKIAGVLSDAEMRELKLIKQYNDKNFNPTVYDLSLGSCHYVYGTQQNNVSDSSSIKWIPVCIGTDKEFNELNANLPDGEKFIRQNKHRKDLLVIPAMGSALIQLHEIIDTYSVAKDRHVLVTGRFDLKLSLVNRGLLSQQGTQVEPCYCGRLYCFVHNLSNKDIEIRYKEAIASIEFAYVSCFCNENKRIEVINELIKKNIREKRYLKEEYCFEGMGIENVMYFNRRKTLPDSCGLAHITATAKKAVTDEAVVDDIANKVKPKVDFKGNTILTIIKVVGSIIVALIGALAVLYKYQADNLDLQKEMLTNCSERLEILESQYRADNNAVPTSSESSEVN